MARRKIAQGMLRGAIVFAVAIALMSVVAMLARPSRAFAVDASDPNYYQSLVGSSDGGAASQKISKGMGLSAPGEDGPLFPSFQQVGLSIIGGLIAFVPVLFVAKFAGRAIYTLMTGVTVENGMPVYPNPPRFLQTSVERGPMGNWRENRARGRRMFSPGGKHSGGGPVDYDATRWYKDMFVDFLRYFGIALGIGAILGLIIGGVTLVMDMVSGANTGGGFMSSFGF